MLLDFKHTAQFPGRIPHVTNSRYDYWAVAHGGVGNMSVDSVSGDKFILMTDYKLLAAEAPSHIPSLLLAQNKIRNWRTLC